MDTEVAVRLLLTTVEEHWFWLSAALFLGLGLGWISYSPGRAARTAGR